jgi:hypothetical protein
MWLQSGINILLRQTQLDAAELLFKSSKPFVQFVRLILSTQQVLTLVAEVDFLIDPFPPSWSNLVLSVMSTLAFPNATTGVYVLITKTIAVAQGASDDAQGMMEKGRKHFGVWIKTTGLSNYVDFPLRYLK